MTIRSSFNACSACMSLLITVSHHRHTASTHRFVTVTTIVTQHAIIAHSTPTASSDPRISQATAAPRTLAH